MTLPPSIASLPGRTAEFGALLTAWANLNSGSGHRAGLDRGKRLWIMLSEFNYDVVGQSFYLEPVPPLGKFSDAFFKPIVARIIKAAQTQAAKAVRRDV